MSSPRVMVKSCVGGGREESFFEHPDAVRISVCGFLCADFFVRILDFCVWISVRISTRIFFKDFLAGRPQGE